MGASVAFEVARRVPVLAPVRLRAASVVRHRFDSTHTADDDALVDDMLSLDGTSARLLADEEVHGRGSHRRASVPYAVDRERGHVLTPIGLEQTWSMGARPTALHCIELHSTPVVAAALAC